MDDNLKLIVEAAINRAKSQKEINIQIKEIQKVAQAQAKEINLDVKINTKDIKSAMLQVEQQVNSMEQFSLKAQTGANRLAIFEKQLKSVAKKEYASDINSIKNAFANVTDQKSLTGANNQLREFETRMKSMGYVGDTVFSRLKKNAMQLFNFLSSATVVMGAINSIRNTINTVVELDKSLTDLAIASDGTYESTYKLLMSYNKMGQEMGATTKEVADSADAFLRQGKSIEDTNELVRDSIILSKLGQIDSAQATQYLTSATKGYNVAVKDTIGIVDKLTAVDNKSATSAGGLAEGMSKVANMANMSGISMDKLLGYLAIVGETTQKQMSEVGNSFQTIFSRLGNIKVGKFIDDETGEDISQVESVLSKLGIELRNNQGNFRNFGDVLDEIGDKWVDLSNVEKNAVGVAIAGVRNRENFNVLMNGYGKALEYAGVAANSSGTALKKYEIVEDSIEAKSKKFTATLEELASTVLDSDLIKGAIDFGSGFLGTLTEIIKALNKTKTLIPLIIASITTLNGKKIIDIQQKTYDSKGNQTGGGISFGNMFGGENNYEQAKQSLIAYTQAVDSGIEKQQAFDMYLQNSSKSTKKLAQSYQAGTGGLISYSKGLKSVGIQAQFASIKMGLLNTVINMGIIGLISMAVQGLIKLVDISITTMDEQREITQKSIDTYQKYKSEIDEINNKLDENIKRIDELNSKPNLTFVEKDEIQKLKDSNYELEREQRLLDDKAKRASNKATKNIEKEFNKEHNYKDGDFEYYISNFNPDTKLNKSGKDQMAKYLDSLLDIKKKLDEAGTDTSNDFYKNVTKSIDLIDKKLNPNEYKQGIFNKIFDENMTNDMKSKLNILSTTSQLSAKDIETNFSNCYKALVEDGTLSTKEIVEQFNALSKESGKISFKDFSYSDMLKEVESNVENLTSAYETLSDGQELSYNQILNLITNYPQLLQYYDAENNTLQINKQILEDVFQTTMQTTKQKIQAKKEEAEAELALAKTMLERFSIENMVASGSINSTWGWQQRTDALTKYADAQARLNEANNQLKSVSNVSLGNYVSRSSSSKSSEDTWLKAFNKELEALQRNRDLNIIDETTYLNTLESLNQKYFANRTKYLSEYWKYEKEIYDGRKKLMEEAKSAIEKLRDLTVNLIKKEQEDKKKALETDLDNIKKLADARKKALQDQQDQEKHAQDLAEKNADINKIKSRLNDLDRGGTLDYAGQKEKLELQEKLSEKQKDLIDFEKDYAIKTQEEQIDKEVENAEKLYNGKIKEIEIYLSNQERLVKDATTRMNGMSQTLMNQLIDYNKLYGDGIRQNITTSWDEAYNALKRYGSLLDVTGTLNNLSSATAKSVPSSPASTPTSTPTSAQATLTQGQRAKATATGNAASDGSQWGASASNKGYIGYIKTGAKYPYRLDSENGTALGWYKKEQLQAYSNGGTIDYTGLAMVHGSPNSPETAFNATDSKKLYNLVHNSSNLAETIINKMLPDIKGITNNISSNNQTPIIKMGNIIIQGNADDKAIQQLQKMEDRLVRKMCGELNKAQFNRGR